MIRTVTAVVVAAAAVLQSVLLAAAGYDFDLTYDPATATVSGTQVISFTRNELPGDTVLMLLNNVGAIPNPHRNPIHEDALYQSGFEPGATEITGIVDAAGNAVAYEAFTPPVHDRLYTYPIPGLAVRLRLAERDHYRLSITFRTRLPALRTADGTSRGGVFVQRFAWFPRLYPDPARFVLPPIDHYRLRIAVPHSYRVISHAEKRTATADGAVYLIESRTPVVSIPLSIFPADHFRLLESAGTDPPVRLFYRPGHERQARKLIRHAAAALEHYAAALGPLDYRLVTMLEGVRPGVWGMAADGFVMLGSGAFNADVPIPEAWDRLLEFIVAHEIGHFYFGIGTAADFISANWLSESLTQYVTIDYLEGKYGADDNLLPDTLAARVIGALLPADSFREQLVREFHSLRVSGYDFPVVSELEERNQNGLTAVIYHKGALAVRQLAAEMGKEAFDEALADYARQFHVRYVDTAGFIAHLEQRQPGMARIGAQVLHSNRYPDYAVQRVVYEGGVSTISIRDHGDSGLSAPVRVVVEDGGGAGERVREFTVRGAELLKVGGTVREVAIDPDWYTLDTNRKNNHYPRKVNWLVERHSRYEADLVGVDVRLLEGSADEVSVGAGVGYSSTGRVSYELGAGVASRIDLPAPGEVFTTQPEVKPGAYAALGLALPGNAGADAGFTWYQGGDWSAALSYRQPLRVPVEVGTRPTFYSDQLALVAGLAADQRPALQPWLGLDSFNLAGAVPHFGSLRQRATLLPQADAWSLESSLALAVPLRLVPRVYLVPGLDLGADWRLFGIGSAVDSGVESRLRAGDRGPAGGPPLTGRLRGSLDLIFTLLGGREDRLLNLVVFRSLAAALYFEAENRFSTLSALAGGRDWRPHAGIELSAGFTTLLDLPVPLGVGLDVPLFSAAEPSTWRLFLSLNVPLRLYTTLLAD